MVLFLDLVGFTRLSESLDHEVLHRVTSRIMGLLSAVVRSYGGYVDKFEGDRIMVLFGARVAAENDSARATACALRLLSLLTELSPMLPAGGLPARVGLSCGPVTVAPDAGGHLTAIGTPVNLASRLEEMASPGTALVDSAVMKECAGLFLWRDAGELRVRGLTEPVHCFEPVEPNPVRRERWHRLADPSRALMVGRKEELDVLLSWWNGCRSGRDNPVLVQITGEPGIGKSRLLHEFIAGIGDGVCILHGHTDPFTQPPLHLWTGLLREHLLNVHDGAADIAGALAALADSCPDRETAQSLRQVTPLLCGLLSRDRDAGLETGGDAGGRNSAAIRILVDAIGAGSPLVLALEDLHWMDEPSLATLRLILSGAERSRPLLVVTTERPPRFDPAGLAVTAGHIPLEPLSDVDVLSLALRLIDPSETSDATIDLGAGDLIIRGARGNPFFAEELTLGLLDSGNLKEGPDGEWLLTVHPWEIVVPDSVQGLVQARIDRLPSRERMVLHFASVQGAVFRTDVLEMSIRDYEPGLDVSASVAELCSMGFLSRGGGEIRAFRHDLVQKASYGTMLRHNRRVVHRSVAGAIEKLPPEERMALGPALFRHWREAGEIPKALECAPDAMNTAGDGGQIEEALRISRWILDVTEDDTSDRGFQAKMKALATRQSLLYRAGRNDEAGAVVAEMLAAAAGNVHWEAEALRAKAIGLHEAGFMDRVEPLLTEALSKAAEAGSEELAGRILGSLANYHSDTGNLEEALSLFQRSLAIRERLFDKPKTGVLFSNIANLYSRTGNYALSEEYYRKAVEIHTSQGDRVSLGYALNGLAICLARAGSVDEAGGIFMQALSAHTDTGNRREQAAVLTNLGTLAKMRGDYETSLAYRTRSLAIARETGSQGSVAIALLNIGNLRRLMGHPEETGGYCETALEICEGIRDRLSSCFCLSIHGLAALDLCDTELAVKLQARATALIDEYGIRQGVIDDYHELTDRMTSMGLRPAQPAVWGG